MRKLELICDYCGKKAKGEEHHYGLPKGWVVLGFHSQTFIAYDDWRIIYHFCSSECMNKMLNVPK